MSFPAAISGALLACLALACRCTAQQPAFSYLRQPSGCIYISGYTEPVVCDVPNAQGTFAVPNLGGVYEDYNFGGAVRLIGAWKTSHAYSTPSPFNANGTRAFVNDQGGIAVVDTSTGSVRSRVPRLTEPPRWDSVNVDKYYQIADSRILSFTASTGQSQLLSDFNTAPFGFASIEAGGTGDLSKDNWITFIAKSNNQVCAMDLTTSAAYCADYSKIPRAAEYPSTDIDFPLITKGVDSVTGKRYVILIADPAMLVFSVDLASHTLAFEFRGPEFSPDMQLWSTKTSNGNNVCDPGEMCWKGGHVDSLEDIDGQQYLVTTMDVEVPCQRQIVFLRLNAKERLLLPIDSGGGRVGGPALNRCGGGPYESWTGSHVGCARSSAYCVISIEGNDTLSTQSRPRTTFESEIIAMSGIGRVYRRLAQSRSMQFVDEPADQQYWSQPRAAISADGSQVLWDTNFGYVGRGRLVVIGSTGFGPPADLRPVLAVSRTKVVGGQSVAASISLSGPVYGATVGCALTSSQSLIATPPGTIELPSGALQVYFQITTIPQPKPVLVEISAACLGKTSSVAFVVESPSLDSVTFNPTVTTGGQSVTLQVQMNGVLATKRTNCTATKDSTAVTISNTLTLNAGSNLTALSVPTAVVANTKLVTVTITCPPTVPAVEWPGIPSDAPGTIIRSATLSVRQVQIPQKDRIGFFRSGGFVLDRNGDNAYSGPTVDYVFPLGLSSDYPISGDWKNSGRGTVGIFRDGVWYFDDNGDNRWDWGTDSYCYYGIRGDIPLIGDWTGDGVLKIGVYRNGTWFLDYNGNRSWDTNIDRIYTMGEPGDIPIVGDWTGTGVTRVGLFRRGLWILDVDGDFTITAKDTFFAFGTPGELPFGTPVDIPLVGDWLGDGRQRPGFFRNGVWTLDVGDGSAFRTGKTVSFTFGYPGDKPMVGKWK